MAPVIATASGRSRTAASRSGGLAHPAIGTAGTWAVRLEAVAGINTDGHVRLACDLQRMSTLVGGTAIPEGLPLNLLVLSEAEAVRLTRLTIAGREALRQALNTALQAALAHAPPLESCP
jgi:hypothetical protein